MNNFKSNINVTDSTDLETTYHQARDAYNQITDFGNSTRFIPELIPPNIEYLNELDQQLQPFYKLIYQLRDIFIIFQKLADQHFSKAYFSLAIMYLVVFKSSTSFFQRLLNSLMVFTLTPMFINVISFSL
jgi:hypothetical protein